MAGAQLDKVKRRLGIENAQQDDLILDLIEDAESYFKVLTGESEIDSKYEFMIRSVALKLYNRKGSEGMDSENVDGYSVSYSESLFEEFMPTLERDFNLNDDDSTHKGRVMFY